MSATLYTIPEVSVAVARRAQALRLAKGLRQADLAAQAGVALPTLKAFEQTGQGSLDLVVRIAFTLGAEEGFLSLFPEPEARSMDELLEAQAGKRQRGRRAA